MSGYKRAMVTISQEEYRRLHQADVKRRFQEIARKVKGSSETRDLFNALQQMESRQRQFEEALSILDHGINQVETDAMQEILRENSLCYERLIAVIGQTTADTNRSLESLSQYFAEEMQKQRQQHQQNIQGLVQRLSMYDQKEQAKAEAARKWLKQSVAFAEFIQGKFDHERFLPGKLFRILGSLKFAQNNLAQGFFESSLQASQQAFLQLSELHFELEQRILEWQTEFERARSILKQSIAELEQNATIPALGLAGEELPEQVDVAYWSNGRYRDLLDKCQHFLDMLSQEQRSLSAEEMRHANHELLSIIQERFESIIYQARLNALNSQLRMNIAEQALQALEVHGFSLNEAGYVDKDMRAPFTAQLSNSDGSRVTIQVLPTDRTTQELANELVVVTKHPSLKTEQEARLQWEELCRTLNQYNLNVGRPEIHTTPPASTERAGQPPILNQEIIISERQPNVQ
jgi:hypothetical protein